MEQRIQDLLLAVSANRTMIHYGHKHVCRKHECKVDKNHIDICDLINLPNQAKVTEYNAILNTTAINNLAAADKSKIVNHFTTLANIINKLVKENTYVPVADSIRLK